MSLRRSVSGHPARISAAAAAVVWGAAIWGAASGAPAGAGAGATPACAPIVVSNSGTPTVPASVAEFAAGANGNVAPANVVGGARSSQLVTASGLAVDPAGFLYVAAPHINALNVYAPGSSGDVAPYAVLSGANTGLNNPQGIVIQGGKLYVANGPFGSGSTGSPSIAVFALPLAAGTDNVAPVAVLAGPATGLASPFGLALDAAGNIFVANVNNTVTEYAPLTPSSYAAPDNAAPILTITNGLATPEGIAIRGSTLYAANDNNSITEYSLPDGTLIRTITGPDTGLAGPLGGLSFDESGNLYVVSTGTAATGNQILEFAAGATGDARPIAAISGPATTLNAPEFVLYVPCGTPPVTTTTLPPTTVPSSTTTTLPPTTTTTLPPTTTTTTLPPTTTTTTLPPTTTTTLPPTTTTTRPTTTTTLPSTTTTRPTTTTTLPPTTSTTVPSTTTTRPATTTTAGGATSTTCKPGNGKGDKNHCHSGPPGGAEPGKARVDGRPVGTSRGLPSPWPLAGAGAILLLSLVLPFRSGVARKR